MSRCKEKLESHKFIINTKVKNKSELSENKLILLKTMEINSIVQNLYNNSLLEHLKTFNLLYLNILSYFLCII